MLQFSAITRPQEKWLEVKKHIFETMYSKESMDVEAINTEQPTPRYSNTIIELERKRKKLFGPTRQREDLI